MGWKPTGKTEVNGATSDSTVGGHALAFWSARFAERPRDDWFFRAVHDRHGIDPFEAMQKVEGSNPPAFGRLLKI
jgi:hypothetical protein